MAYCRNCGAFLNHSGAFCENCGTPSDPQTSLHKVQGRGLAITSLILSIFGLALSLITLIVYLWVNASPVLARDAVLTLLPLSIMAVCFGSSAKKKGYVSGLSKTGVTLGIIGIVLFSIPVLLMLAFL